MINVVDDLLAITIIALFYTRELHPLVLLLADAALALLSLALSSNPSQGAGKLISGTASVAMRMCFPSACTPCKYNLERSAGRSGSALLALAPAGRQPSKTSLEIRFTERKLNASRFKR